MDFPEHTSEEERKAIAVYNPRKKQAVVKKQVNDECDLDALFAASDAHIQPIYELDAFTYWIQRLVGETIFREIPAPDPAHDSPEVMRDKEFYGKAVANSHDVAANQAGFLAPLNPPSDRQAVGALLREADILVTTTTGSARFYPTKVAYDAASGDELAILEFLHVAHHLRSYAVAIITRCCMDAGEAVYTNKSYVELWQWLAADGCHSMPISRWPTTSTVPFVHYMRALHHVYATTQEAAAFNEV